MEESIGPVDEELLQENFYLLVLEKKQNRAIVHLWRMTLSSHSENILRLLKADDVTIHCSRKRADPILT